MRAGAVILFAASWLGAQDHVGKPVPDYVTGDECLFCHDRNIGITWQTNPHAWTIRPVGIEPSAGKAPDGATHVLGSGPRVRWLKLAGYGKFEMLAGGDFAKRCAGCHTTAVDPKTLAFSTFALDCYTCHGVVPPEHSADTSKVWLSKKHDPAPKAVVQICGQCHLRGGNSRSTGLPYPNNFVPGDNLLRDFEVNLTAKTEDDHVFRNVRAVMEGGKTTCVSCHRIHRGTSVTRAAEMHSAICGY